MTLYHDQSVSHHILVGHEPWFAIPVPSSANTQSLSLADGVVHQANMLPHHRAIRCLYFSRLVREIAIQKLTEWTLTDKADPSTVFLSRVWQAMISGNFAHIALVEMANRE